MTKKKTLINERVIRRWGKLANMPSLTENYLGTIDEQEEEMELDAVEVEDDGGEEEEVEMDAEIEMEPEEVSLDLSEDEAELLVQAIADAVSDVTGVEVDVESAGAEGDLEAAADDLGDAEADLEDLVDDEAGLGGERAYNRNDELGETLDLEVIDDGELTEAVLKRVVERLLSKN
jgi:hypothetical protein